MIYLNSFSAVPKASCGSRIHPSAAGVAVMKPIRKERS